MKIPTKEECYLLLKENKVPKNIIAHSVAVAKAALQIYDQIKDNHKINPDMLVASALLHDIEKVKPNHIKAGEEFLKSRQFHHLAEIIGEHGILNPPKTIYSKILFYADKRVIENKIVPLQKRINYINKKYNLMNNGLELLTKIAKDIEKELNLIPDNIK